MKRILALALLFVSPAAFAQASDTLELDAQLDIGETLTCDAVWVDTGSQSILIDVPIASPWEERTVEITCSYSGANPFNVSQQATFFFNGGPAPWESFVEIDDFSGSPVQWTAADFSTTKPLASALNLNSPAAYQQSIGFSIDTAQTWGTYNFHVTEVLTTF